MNKLYFKLGDVLYQGDIDEDGDLMACAVTIEELVSERDELNDAIVEFGGEPVVEDPAPEPTLDPTPAEPVVEPAPEPTPEPAPEPTPAPEAPVVEEPAPVEPAPAPEAVAPEAPAPAEAATPAQPVEVPVTFS